MEFCTCLNLFFVCKTFKKIHKKNNYSLDMETGIVWNVISSYFYSMELYFRTTNFQTVFVPNLLNRFVIIFYYIQIFTEIMV